MPASLSSPDDFGWPALGTGKPRPRAPAPDGGGDVRPMAGRLAGVTARQRRRAFDDTLHTRRAAAPGTAAATARGPAEHGGELPETVDVVGVGMREDTARAVPVGCPSAGGSARHPARSSTISSASGDHREGTALTARGRAMGARRLTRPAEVRQGARRRWSCVRIPALRGTSAAPRSAPATPR